MTERPDLEGLSTLAAAFSIRADDAGRLAKLLVEVCTYALALERQHAASQAELAYTKSWTHAAGGNLNHMDGVAVTLRAENATLARELGAAREALERLTAVLNQDGGWCNHGVLMDRPYHPRCSHCVLNQVRSAIAAGETDR
jgi:hypothetical protein